MRRAGIVSAWHTEEGRALNKDDNDKTSRRRLLAGGVAVLAGAGMVASQARAQEKLAQTIVQYQETPKDGQKCSDCVNFVAPAACKIVDGKINPQGWCVAFAPKS